MDYKLFEHILVVLQGYQNRLLDTHHDLSEQGKPIPSDLMQTMAQLQTAIAGSAQHLALLKLQSGIH